MTVMLSFVGTGLLMILQLANRYGIPSFDEPTGPEQSFPGSGDEAIFLTLDFAPPTRSYLGSNAMLIRIGTVHVPPVYDRPQLARQVNAGSISIDEFAQWGAPLTQLLQTTLTRDLCARLPLGRVIAARAPSGPDARTLAVDLVSLVERGGRLELEGSWTLSGNTQEVRHERAEKRAPLQLSTPLVGSEPTAFAFALSRLIGRVEDEIAEATLPVAAARR